MDIVRTPGGIIIAKQKLQLLERNIRRGKHTLIVEFKPSEFSRLRLQFARDQARDSTADNQLLLQYQMSLGAHGAHGY